MEDYSLVGKSVSVSYAGDYSGGVIRAENANGIYLEIGSITKSLIFIPWSSIGFIKLM